MDGAFLTGAGISMPAPSSLPSGTELTLQTCACLRDSGEHYLDDPALERVDRRIMEETLRLELLMELIGKEIPKELAVSVYSVFLGRVPNRNHFALASLKGTKLFTVNMDVLIERAGKELQQEPIVIHLHGKCTDLSSIISMVSQYLEGLSRENEKSFLDGIEGRVLYVMGYSGRDRDLMPLVISGGAAQIVWFHHPGSEMSPELRRGKEQLGDRLQIRCVDVGEWLLTQVTREERTRIESSVKALEKDDLTPLDYGEVQEQFRSLTPGDRTLALCRLVEHIGEYDAVHKALKAMNDTKKEMSSNYYSSRGRVGAHRGEFATAVKDFRRAYAEASTLNEAARALLGEAMALRNGSRAPEAQAPLEVLDKLLSKPTGKEAWRRRAWMYMHRADIKRMDGNNIDALEEYKKGAECFEHGEDIGGRIHVLTWQADCYKVLGQFRDAIQFADRAIDEAAFYSRRFALGWPYWSKGETLSLTGEVDPGTRLLEKARRIFEKTGNIQGHAYCLIVMAEYLREKGLSENAMVLLDEVESLCEGNDSNPLAYVRAWLYLERGDTLRAERNWTGALEWVEQIRDHLRDTRSFHRSPPRLVGHTLLLEGEIFRDQEKQALATNKLSEARAIYERMSARWSLARCDVALFLNSHREEPEKELIELCSQAGYATESEWLLGKRTGYYPVHFI